MEQQTALVYDIKEFGILFKDTAIAAKYANQILMDTLKTYKQDINVDNIVSCTGAPAGDPSTIGLWQWVTETNDGQGSMLTAHSVCRYGSISLTAPACPWNACAPDSADCSACNSDWQLSAATP
uniref:Uncharacterized protein n=1 Tax=Favella ehrenbergii TaxID=182087 RepID=A0A7S3MJE1_9SPIT